MLKATITYNRKAKGYDVTLEQSEFVYMDKNTYWFNNEHQAIGVLISTTVGPQDIKQRCALLNCLIAGRQGLAEIVERAGHQRLDIVGTFFQAPKK